MYTSVMSQDMAGIAPIQEAQGGAVRGNSDDPALGFSVNGGWIKIHRKIKDKGYYRNSQYFHLWVHLLLSANHSMKEYMTNGQIIMIKEGQLLTGRKQLSADTGIPEGTIERILKVLENEHQIEQQKTTKYRLITIVKWKDYQKDNNTSDNKRTTNGQRVDTNKNVKKKKNDKKTSTALDAGNEVNQLIGLFKPLNPSIESLYGRIPQRAACERLLKTHGFEQVAKALTFAEKRRADRFCPTITTPTQLEDKWGALEAYAVKLKESIKPKVVSV